MGGLWSKKYTDICLSIVEILHEPPLQTQKKFERKVNPSYGAAIFDHCPVKLGDFLVLRILFRKNQVYTLGFFQNARERKNSFFRFFSP